VKVYSTILYFSIQFTIVLLHSPFQASRLKGVCIYNIRFASMLDYTLNVELAP